MLWCRVEDVNNCYKSLASDEMTAHAIDNDIIVKLWLYRESRTVKKLVCVMSLRSLLASMSPSVSAQGVAVDKMSDEVGGEPETKLWWTFWTD